MGLPWRTEPPPSNAKPGPYVTKLTPVEEQEFRAWVAANKIPWQDVPNADYDMRGFWKAMKSGDPIAARSGTTGHFPDKWKTPYHATFSNESVYALPTAPRWVDGKLVDRSGKVITDESNPAPTKIKRR